MKMLGPKNEFGKTLHITNFQHAITNNFSVIFCNLQNQKTNFKTYAIQILFDRSS